MATRKAADVESALEAKGMDRDENHHHMFRKEIDGVTQLVTRISHAKGEVNNHLGKLMGNQCCLQLKEFWEARGLHADRRAVGCDRGATLPRWPKPFLRLLDRYVGAAPRRPRGLGMAAPRV